MTLTEWMFTAQGSRWTCETLAAAIGVKRGAIFAWRRGARPNHTMILRIAMFTQGAVSPDDWYPELRDQRRWPVGPLPEPTTVRTRRPWCRGPKAIEAALTDRLAA